jgi:hypothetical protein
VPTYLIGTRCLIVSAPQARQIEGRECVIFASYTKGHAPTAWYRAKLNDDTIVTGPPHCFMSIDPVPQPIIPKE